MPGSIERFEKVQIYPIHRHPVLFIVKWFAYSYYAIFVIHMVFWSTFSWVIFVPIFACIALSIILD